MKTLGGDCYSIIRPREQIHLIEDGQTNATVYAATSHTRAEHRRRGHFGQVDSAQSCFVFGGGATFAAPATPPSLFEEVPSSVSGITWHQVNGRSSEYYLPETIGAGCAFLDDDNDGWMDIYLVNSGACDFLTHNWTGLQAGSSHVVVLRTATL